MLVGGSSPPIATIFSKWYCCTNYPEAAPRPGSMLEGQPVASPPIATIFQFLNNSLLNPPPFDIQLVFLCGDRMAGYCQVNSGYSIIQGWALTRDTDSRQILSSTLFGCISAGASNLVQPLLGGFGEPIKGLEILIISMKSSSRSVEYNTIYGVR